MERIQSSEYANHLMESANTSQTKSTKKKLRFFSKSKKRDSDYGNLNQCYCEDCVRINHNNRSVGSQQPYYYPNENPMVRTRSLSSSGEQQQPQQDQRLYGPEEHTYMEVAEPYLERIYAPPQQYPCECTQCRKNRGSELTTELLPLDTQIPLQMMSDSAVLCTIL